MEKLFPLDESGNLKTGNPFLGPKGLLSKIEKYKTEPFVFWWVGKHEDPSEEEELEAAKEKIIRDWKEDIEDEPADEEEKKSWKETREKTLEYFYDDYLSEKERNELNEEEKLKLVLEKKLAQEEENVKKERLERHFMYATRNTEWCFEELKIEDLGSYENGLAATWHDIYWEKKYLQIEEKEITITKFDEKTGAERNVQKKKKTTALEKLNKQANYSYVKFATKKLGMAHLTTERITNYRAFHKEIKRVIEANELVFEAKHYKINVFMLQNALAQAFTSGGLSSQKWVEHEFFNKLGDALKKVAEKDSGAWPGGGGKYIVKFFWCGIVSIDNQFTSCLKKYFEIIAEETAEMRQEELLKEEKDAWLEKTNKNIELKAKAREQCLKKIANLEKDILFLSTPEPQPAPEAMPTSWTTLFWVGFLAIIYFGWDKFWTWYEKPVKQEWDWEDEEEEEN